MAAILADQLSELFGEMFEDEIKQRSPSMRRSA